ncbi:MAG: VOC family protein [Acidobacteriaceae bacterium]|nr:VOC family protein [Acidobacteriaceae bacterium]
MAKVTGIGGVFLRSPNPKQLTAWYAEHLGLHLTDYGIMLQYADDLAVQPKDTSMTIWSAFPADTKYFGEGHQGVMINYRVDDLPALLKKLEAAGIWIDPKQQNEEYGRFAWIKDCDGNRLELWQPLGESAEDGKPSGH